jgi:hypothetical protein
MSCQKVSGFFANSLPQGAKNYSSSKLGIVFAKKSLPRASNAKIAFYSQIFCAFEKC